MRRVAITGIGIVSALGVGVNAFWEGLRCGKSGSRRLSLVDPALLNTQIAAEVPDFDPEVLLPGTSLEMLDRFSQLALVAGAEAVSDAERLRNSNSRFPQHGQSSRRASLTSISRKRIAHTSIVTNFAGAEVWSPLPRGRGLG